MMIDRDQEREMVRFLSDLVALYKKHNVSTDYDYDYCAFKVGDNSIEFPEYQGEGYFDHYPKVDSVGRDRLIEVGDRLFLDEVSKKVDKPDADKIIPVGSPMNYVLKCRVYDDRSDYFIVASAYNESSGQYEQREKPAPLHELFK